MTKEEEKKEKECVECQNDDNKKCCHEKDSNKEHKNKGHKCKEYEKQIASLKQEIIDLTKKVQYSQAELINYRKRKDEEVDNFKKYCNKDIISELIPVIDNFERAIKLDDNDLTDELSKFLEGFKMMYASLMDILKKFGVEEISRQGEVFDSTQEEALMTDNLPEYDDDVVTEVLLKGYKLKDRVIRPASVKINKKN